MIAVDSLSKSYGEQVLFENISFKINRKERVGLVGRNGHGKTTLFRLIAGLEEPDPGRSPFPAITGSATSSRNSDFSEASVFGEAIRALGHGRADEIWRVGEDPGRPWIRAGGHRTNIRPSSRADSRSG